MVKKGTLIMDVIALFMTGIMMYHIKTKYTAVGKLFYILVAQSRTLELIRFLVQEGKKSSSSLNFI